MLATKYVVASRASDIPLQWREEAGGDSTAGLRELRAHYVDSMYVYWWDRGVVDEVMQGLSDLIA